MILTAAMLAASTPCPLPAQWGMFTSNGDMPNSVVIANGATYWNSLPVNKTELASYARRSGSLPGARIILKMANVDCEALKRTAAVIAAATKCTPTKCVVNFGGRAAPTRR